MKRLTALLLCVILLVCSVGCDNADPVPENTPVDVRTAIREDNLSEVGEDNTAGGKWLVHYASALSLSGGAALYEEHFRTGEFSEGFELCFSKWTADGKTFLITEAVYGDGKRYLCDIYELTAVESVNRIDYALGRIEGDGRFDITAAEHTNGFGENVTEYNITDEVPQTYRCTLLGKQSIMARELMYGEYLEGNGYTVKVKADVSTDGIGRVIQCNETTKDTSKSAYLLNETFYVGYSPYTGDFAVINRQYKEEILYEEVDTQDETRRKPSVFSTYDDKMAIYTVESLDGIVAYGIYDGIKQKNYLFEDGSTPLAVGGNRLYFRYTAADGAYALAFRYLDDPEAPVVPLDSININDSVRQGVTALSFSENEKFMAILTNRADGVSEVSIFTSDTGVFVEKHEITGKFCSPRYAGFLSDGSIMVLSDKKLLCDEYLFIIETGV